MGGSRGRLCREAGCRVSGMGMSRYSTTFMLTWAVIFSANSLKVLENPFLILLAVLGPVFFSAAMPSSRQYWPIFAGRYLLESLLVLSIKRPTSLHTSAPS